MRITLYLAIVFRADDTHLVNYMLIFMSENGVYTPKLHQFAPFCGEHDEYSIAIGGSLVLGKPNVYPCVSLSNDFSLSDRHFFKSIGNRIEIKNCLKPRTIFHSFQWEFQTNEDKNKDGKNNKMQPTNPHALAPFNRHPQLQADLAQSASVMQSF